MNICYLISPDSVFPIHSENLERVQHVVALTSLLFPSSLFIKKGTSESKCISIAQYDPSWSEIAPKARIAASYWSSLLL